MHIQVLQPGNGTFLTTLQKLRRDPEAEIYEILVDLRCADFLDLYVATLESDQRMGTQKQMPLGLKAFGSIGGWTSSFHPLNNGIDFRSDCFAHGLRYTMHLDSIHESITEAFRTVGH